MIWGLILAVLLVGCSGRVQEVHKKETAGGTPPSWVIDRTSPRHPEPFYMTGVGMSPKNFDEAEDRARIDLVKQIEVELTGEETAIQMEAGRSGEAGYLVEERSTVSSRITAKTRIQIAGLRIGERWRDEARGGYYALATLDRDTASRQMVLQISEARSTADGLIQKAREAESAGDRYPALQRYRRAHEVLEEVRPLLTRYRVIAGAVPDREPPSPLNLPDVADQIDRLQSSLGMKPAVDASKPLGWEDGIRDLVLQMVRSLPSEGTLTLRVDPILQGGSLSRGPLGDLLRSELEAVLAQVEGVVVAVPSSGGKVPESTFAVSGLFWREERGLRVNALLTDPGKGTVVSAGRVILRADEIPEEVNTSAPQRPETPTTSSPAYPTLVEQVAALEREEQPFRVEVWTDQPVYRIGEAVTFSFRSSRDGYLTLFDIGTSGEVRVLYPNRFHPDSFVEAGKIYRIPDPSAGFQIRVAGPSGLERVKAIATLEPVTLLDVDLSAGFFSISPESRKGARDLMVVPSKLKDQTWAEDMAEIHILAPGEISGGRSRALQPKPPEDPIDIIGVPGRK
ncbi:MAG: DUF4384 domain-containing protein [Nitrospirae bacterium]|nr:DUF4384 domain-containing protein [Nitrospirota bacterium]